MSTVLFGRFVKDTEYTREQVLEGGKIVADVQSLPVALSSFFCIFLAEHRMAYVAETRSAPTLDVFAKTIERLLRKEFTKFIEKIYREEKAQNPRFTRANAFARHVPPTVHVVPLPAKQSIRDFVGRFENIRSLTINLIERNNELTRELFGALVDTIVKTKPVSAKVVANGGNKGLDVAATTDLVVNTTEFGYEDVVLEGKDKDGNKIKGGNEEFKLTADVADTLEGFDLAKDLYKKFSELKSQGQIKTGELDPEEADAVRRALEALSRAAE